MAEQLKSYRELKAWQLARALVKNVYIRTKELPVEERFGLIAQMRSSAISIPANIAEGYGRRGRGDYVRFVSIAHGSLYELETYVILSMDLGFFSEDDPLLDACDEVGRVVAALERSLAPRKS